MESEYLKISKELRQLKDEYFKNPSKELFDKIYDLDKKLRIIDASI